MKIIMIGSNKGLTRGAILSLTKKKRRFSLIGTKNVIYAASGSKLCDAFYEIEGTDMFQHSGYILEMIRSEMDPNEKNYIIPTCMPSTFFVSQYARVVDGVINHFPIADYDTLSLLNNKWDFYLLLKQLEIAAPKSIRCDAKLADTDKQDLPDCPFSFPMIAKPLDSEGGQGVVRLNSKEELANAIHTADLPILIQEFIEGSDMNLGMYTLNGKVLSWVLHRNTEDRGVVFEKRDDVVRAGAKIVETLKFTGILHLDLRCDEKDGTVKVLECNPRVWASMLHSVFVGVNFIESAINHPERNAPFDEVRPGTISITRQALFKKLRHGSVQYGDWVSLLTRASFFLYDPIYSLKWLIK